MPTDWDDDDDKPANPKVKKRFEFECPGCNALNPWPDGFKDREEVQCHYCGLTYEARMQDDGRLKFREL